MVNAIILISSYLFMEFAAWFTHKYVMHGFLWSWHKDHHRKDRGKGIPERTERRNFEKNDLFFLVYALPAIVAFNVGFTMQISWLLYMGTGITLYGLTYFVIHDIMVHKRLPAAFLRKRQNFYIKALIKAHSAHHKPETKQDFHNYGLLVFPLRFFNQ